MKTRGERIAEGKVFITSSNTIRIGDEQDNGVEVIVFPPDEENVVKSIKWIRKVMAHAIDSAIAEKSRSN